ncbi:hypothetical protein RND81_13G164200 [Saponaria officinalis]|uniref:Transmembrane protein n=1 Tax=Saponaria officinalis TaxID=3572 RepID=A0AAW1H6H9_SAPOF
MGKLYIICSILMATLFVTSSFVQFNDPDWYFWIALYAGAAYVNLMNVVGIVSYERTLDVGNVMLILGQFLLSKVVLEGGLVRLLSMDLRERLVRETIGSALVIVCMIFQISASASFDRDSAKQVKTEVAPATKYGMAMLVGIGYGLSAMFLMSSNVGPIMKSNTRFKDT